MTLLAGPLAATAAAAPACQPGPSDASAESLARIGQITAETYGTDNNGHFSGLSPRIEHMYEPTVTIAPSSRHAYLSSAHGTASGYSLTVRAPDGDTFTITSNNGQITRRWKRRAPACSSTW
jgi:hypothetical protein